VYDLQQAACSTTLRCFTRSSEEVPCAKFGTRLSPPLEAFFTTCRLDLYNIIVNRNATSSRSMQVPIMNRKATRR